MRPLAVTVAAGGVAYAASYIAWPLWRWWPVLAWMAGTVLTVSIRAAVLDGDPGEDIATFEDYSEDEDQDEDDEEAWEE